jgi:two-component system, chemotaxis family, CheB/CheR fusion protein
VSDDREHSGVPVVALIASAGGLDALRQLLEALPRSPGIAIVVATHHRADTRSQLPELLARSTSLEVVAVDGGAALERDHVYVLGGGAHTISAGVIAPASSRDDELPLDHFLAALAADRRDAACAVILSGAGTDGTIGARRLRDAGGLIVAQDPETARHDSMPRSVIAAGLADVVLPPEEIAAWVLERLAAPRRVVPERLDPDVTARIVTLLRERLGRDFSSYKPTTIARRIERRLAIHAIADPAIYLRYLDEHPEELERLFKDLLIRVTAFFRDPEVWERLGDALAEIVAASTGPVRAWIPGCATGEEAYTVAMLLDGVVEAAGRSGSFQVFATDLDATSIRIARTAWYPPAIAEDVSADRLAEYFDAAEGGYRVRSFLRSSVVFAPHDLLSDPPFGRVQLVCCRNVLIYMQPALQEALLALFHQALLPGGLLVLGSSETVAGAADLFDPVDPRARIFRRREGVGRPFRDLRPIVGRRGDRVAAAPIAGTPSARIGQVIDRILDERYIPPSVVVTERGDIVYVHGRTGPYLELGDGRPILNAFSMAQPGLALALTAAVAEALAQGGPAVFRDVEVDTETERVRVDVIARRIDEAPASGLVLVSFERAVRPGGAVEHVAAPDQRIRDLELELRRSRDELHGLIEQLQASNEQLQSSNEELQSTNEELDTSKEELQSVNEELSTVNAELQQRLDELSEVNDDMVNLLDNTEIAIVFLDRSLRIKRFSRPATTLIPMIDADVGRPLYHLRSEVIADRICDLAEEVLRTLVPYAGVVRTSAERAYLMRILPYRAANRVIDGVVVTFVDTTELEDAKALAASRALALGMVETVREPLLVLDADLRVMTANRSFLRAFGCDPADTIGAVLHELGGGAWDVPELRDRLDDIVRGGDPFDDAEVPRPGRDDGATMRVSARPLRDVGGRTDLLLVAIQP